jgi:hypothetical protein
LARFGGGDDEVQRLDSEKSGGNVELVTKSKFGVGNE